jgi:DNA polymerase-3 subunit delta
VAELAKGKVGEVRNFALAKKGRALERQALDFILSESERLGQKLTTQTATAMVAQVGCDMRLLSSEVDKLLLYCGGRAPNEQDVAAVCAASRETEAWDLQDVFGARNLPASLKVLHRLVDQGVSPFFLIIQLQGRVNEMLIIKDSLARKWARGDHGFEWSGDLPEEADAAGADLNARWNPAGKHPFVLSKLVAQTKNFTRYDLRRARSVLMDTRERMVSSGVQPEVILEIGLADALQPMQAAR